MGLSTREFGFVPRGKGFAFPSRSIVKTADFTAAAALALADLPVGSAVGANMELAVTAGRLYRLSAMIGYSTVAGGNGGAFAIIVPAFTHYTGMVQGVITTLQNPMVSTQISGGPINQSGDLAVSSNKATATGETFYNYHCLIAPSANGMVKLQYAAEVASGNITIFKGTVLTIEDITN